VLLLLAGAVISWLKQTPGTLILMGVVSVIFFISAVVTGGSLRRR